VNTDPHPHSQEPPRSDDVLPPGHGGGLVVLLVASLLAGGLAGIAGSLFRLALAELEKLRGALVLWSRGMQGWGWIIPVAVAALGAACARLMVVRFAEDASGSGVPQVEGIVRVGGGFHSRWVLPVKFFGGLTAIGSGLALGREGPTVQMGSAAAEWIGRLFRMSAPEARVLAAAGAGAGLATAFGAPLGGAVFVLEELTQRFHIRVAMASFAASGVAIAVLYRLLGPTPELLMPLRSFPSSLDLVVYLILGLILGALGVAYNRLVLAGLDAGDRLSRVPSSVRAMFVGALVGLVAWFEPQLVGGGEGFLRRVLHDGVGGPLLLLALGVRFVLGPLSYSAGTPGGLFAPLLLVGALVGQLYGTLVHGWLPAAAPDPSDLAVVGMAAFFAATVRAPITGAALIVEMTGVTNLFVPLLAAVSGALLVPTMLGNEPIYDALRRRQPGRGP
jgi:CIC family chloride channel protein